MDVSSELIHALLPIYLVTTMGMSVAALGVLEGAAEATAMIVKIFSGALSDWLGRRKALLLLGYGLAALTKPLFPLAAGPATVAAARLLDRVGKGIRGAPRDALVADVAPPEIRGACFGLRQSMDTVGAFAGPLLAIALMLAFADHIRAVLWFAVVPAFAAVALILFGVEEPASAPAAARAFRSPLHWRALRAFSGRYWFVVLIGTAFTLARFSEAFLVLRAQQVGLDIAWIPAVMVVMSVAYAASAYPVGIVSDKFGARAPLAAGMLLLIAADLLLGASASRTALFAGVAVWGCTWVSRRACSPRSSRKPRRPRCAAPRSACSISRAGSRCSRRARSPAGCGNTTARRRRSSPARRSRPSHSRCADSFGGARGLRHDGRRSARRRRRARASLPGDMRVAVAGADSSAGACAFDSGARAGFRRCCRGARPLGRSLRVMHRRSSAKPRKAWARCG
ncbi:hypothetical protein UKMH10_4605 [Burkholderia pseudomallei]|nr:hypothetical protein UKMH10_4605 [Burkholderia pseudomallei]